MFRLQKMQSVLKCQVASINTTAKKPEKYVVVQMEINISIERVTIRSHQPFFRASFLPSVFLPPKE